MDENQNAVDDEEVHMGNGLQKTFGWLVVVNRIAGNDFTKHEYVYQKKVTEVLNQLSFLIALDHEQEKARKRFLAKG